MKQWPCNPKWTLIAFCVTLCLTITTAVTGCANWNRPELPSAPFSFPQKRLAADAVTIEIGVAQLRGDQRALLETFWQMLDQQELTLSARKRLDRNGLRCGVMSTNPPAEFHQLLQPRLPDAETLDDVGKKMAAAGRLSPISPLLLHQRVSLREGEAYPVGVSKLHAHWKWTQQVDHGETSEDVTAARGFFDLVTYPQPEGSIQLQVTPAIQHGNARPTIDVVEGSFVMDRAQQRSVLNDLAIELQLCVGETLVVAATPPEATLGAGLLAPDRPLAFRLLLVRLVETQMNDLFDRPNDQTR